METGGEVIKLVLLGNEEVGKSSLISKLQWPDMPLQKRERTAKVVGDAIVDVEIDEIPIRLMVWDTVGNDRNVSLNQFFYNNLKACGLVFDITNESSFEQLTSWYTGLREHCRTVPVAIIANKIDLEQKIPEKKIEKKMKESGCEHLIRTSALTGENVLECFKELGRLGMSYNYSHYNGSFTLQAREHRKNKKKCCSS